MKIKPSDLAGRKGTLHLAVGDVDTEGNTIVMEGTWDDDGNMEVTDEMTDEALAALASRETLADNVEPDNDPTDDNMYRTFTDQAFALIGEPTADGRMFASDIDLSFRSFPQPLMWCEQSVGGHSGSYTVGVIEAASVSGTNVLCSGYFLNTDHADSAVNEVGHGVSNPSVDLADADYIFTDKDGNELDEDDLWDIMWDGNGEYFVTFTRAQMIGATLVSTPAFDTKIKLDAERSSREPALVAGIVTEFRPPEYKAALFSNPNLTGPTLPTMGEDGRIYGHIAVFGQCHRGLADSCVFAPHSPTGYSQFHTSPAVRLDDGTRLPVGRLTVGTGHADPRLGAGPAMAHYDNTGTCFALVRVGEDKHGIWFSGVAAPGASHDDIAKGISAPLSGDWRDFGQGLELVAALAVNTPGFNVRGATDEQDRPIGLVASGRLSSKTKRGGGVVSKADIAAAVAAGVDEAFRRAAATAASAELAQRKAAAIERAAAAVGKPKSLKERAADVMARI